MKITKKDLDKWLKEQDQKIEELYKLEPQRRPKEYKSNAEAFKALRDRKIEYLSKQHGESANKKKMDVGAAAKIIATTVAVTAVPVPSGHSLAIYDYDTHMYTFNTTTILNDFMVALMDSSSNNSISTMVMTLTGMRHELPLYNPLPKYKMAVGNGIFNCLTGELEPFSPTITVLTKIKTNYIKNARRPKYRDGFTLEGMIDSLSNGKAERHQLINQICKAILTEHSLKPGLFVILGSGGDGKSTFFNMIANMIGQENVAYVNFSELSSDDKMAETMNKKLVLGMDNDPKTYLKRTALLKTIASHEMITLSRKYLNAISVPFTATMVQLCNDFPRIAETGSSMKRRLVPFKAEHSHFEHGTENDNIDTVYVKDQRFLEYALWYFIDAAYYSDFNDVDRSIALDAFDIEDTLGQFVSEMSHLGVFSDTNKQIPNSHLYAAYLDWMDINNNKDVFGSKNFSLKIKEHMHNLGYTLGERTEVSRPRAIEDARLYSSKSWVEYEGMANLSKAIENNMPSRLFKLTHKSKGSQDVRRMPKVITPLEYFKTDVQIINDLGLNANDIYDDVVDTVEVVDNDTGDTNNKPVENNVTDLNEHKRKQSEQDTVEDESPPIPTGPPLPDPKEKRINKYNDAPYDYEITVKPPGDLRAILQNEDIDGINQMRQWLDDVAEYKHHLPEIGVISAIDEAYIYVDQYCHLINDHLLMASILRVSSDDSVGDKVEAMQSFFDEVIAKFEAKAEIEGDQDE